MIHSGPIKIEVSLNCYVLTATKKNMIWNKKIKLGRRPTTLQPSLYPKSDLILSIVLDFLLWALQCNSYTNYWARSNCTGPEHSPPCGCPPFAHPATSSEIISPPAFLINQLSIPGFSCLFQDQKFNWTTSRSQETLYLQFWLCRKATNQDLQYRDIIALQGSQMWGIHIFRTPTFHIL